MELLAICRHGEDDITGQVTRLGRKQIKNLAMSLKPHLAGRDATVLSSRTLRTKTSAKILVRELQIKTFEEVNELTLDPGHFPQDNERLFQLVSSRAATITGALILMTHLPYAMDLPPLFTHRVLGMNVKKPTLNNGQGYLIFCAERRVLTV